MPETSHRCLERRSNRENLRREVRNQLILAAAGVLSLASLAITAPALSRADKCTDVALVLAVDGSGSVSTEEFYFQQQAIAQHSATGRSWRHSPVLVQLQLPSYTGAMLNGLCKKPDL
jgi:hypothetical protein